MFKLFSENTKSFHKVEVIFKIPREPPIIFIHHYVSKIIFDWW